MAKRKKGTDREKHPFHHIILRVYHLNAHSKFNPRFIYFHPHKKWLLALIKLIEIFFYFFYDYDDEGYLFQLQSYYSQQDLLQGFPQCSIIP